ncbi:5-formyltetrahydrofolate cyclo-ligase family protein [Corynebacterium ciconiae DSM 44920]|uniref:5-formyltetrahydrofolate cyclo-ligase n=1 Tax=Corynebacterium ciconiae TaxID=227319 RepID=UPI000370A096|nr:5-formyltetrahydrofolate cyclo-ligase [Corynebacterium ciconiae]WKD61650.1 5-formyltetrahydrofolate cyclo-ligase family protein [Corynebacterium ciconiae DSM 44920]
MTAEPRADDAVVHKSRIRREMTSRRQALSASQRAEANDAIGAHVANLMASIGARRAAAYVPLANEPGGEALIPLLDSWLDELYLPISGPQGQLGWAQFTGFDNTEPGPYSIPEPTGPRTDNSLLQQLDLIVVPALAATPCGFRLGKGGGYYDRALAQRQPGRPLAAVVLFDDNLVDHLPIEDHDAPVDIIITPSAVRSVE